jgi:hypothetical protein
LLQSGEQRSAEALALEMHKVEGHGKLARYSFSSTRPRA